MKENQQVLLLTSHFDTMPDMYGWSKKNVKKFEDWTGIKVTFKGKKSGKVTEQSVKVGSKLKNLKKIRITLGE